VILARILRLPLIVVILLWTLGTLPGASLAQETSPSEEPSPSPTEEISNECQIGQLCTDVGSKVKPGGGSGPINDPPGSYVKSLLTIAFIGLVVGAYMFIALTGRQFRKPFRRRGAT